MIVGFILDCYRHKWTTKNKTKTANSTNWHTKQSWTYQRTTVRYLTRKHNTTKHLHRTKRVTLCAVTWQQVLCEQLYTWKITSVLQSIQSRSYLSHYPAIVTAHYSNSSPCCKTFHVRQYTTLCRWWLAATYASCRGTVPSKHRSGPFKYEVVVEPVVKVRGARGGSPPCFDFGGVWPPLLESEPILPTAGPKLFNSTKNHNVRCRINKF